MASFRSRALGPDQVEEFDRSLDSSTLHSLGDTALARYARLSARELERRTEVVEGSRRDRRRDFYQQIFGWQLTGAQRKVIRPDGRYYKVWREVLLVIAIYSTCSMPLAFGFFKGHGIPLAWELFDVVINLLFVADIIVHFNLCYFERASNTIVNDHVLIARRYAKSYLLPDILACIPWDNIYRVAGRQEPLRYLNWFKVVRVRFVNHYFIRMEKNDRYNFLFVRIFKLFVVELYYTHLAACLFYYLACTYPAAEEDKTWLGSLVLGSESYHNFRQVDLGKRYCVSLYWAIVTMATVGYGDVHATNPREMIFSMLYISLDMLMSAFLLGNMTALVVRGSRTERFRDRISKVVKFAMRTNLEKMLKWQMKAHTLLQFETEQQEEDILHDFPPSIQARVMRQLYRQLAANSYILSSCSSQFVDQLVTGMFVEYFLPGEHIIERGDASDQMYLVSQGRVEEHSGSEDGEASRVVGLVTRGDWFGEVAVLCSIPQPYTCRALDLCHVLRVEKESLLKLLQLYPVDRTYIVKNLEKRTEEEGITGGKLQELADQISRGIEHQAAEAVTLLIGVAGQGDWHRLRALLSSGVDPSQGDYDQRTALHVAAAKGFDDICLLLLQDRADVNATDQQGRTPLLEALRNGHESTAAILREHGGMLSMHQNGTDLCTAVARGNHEYLKRLLEHGVDPNICDYDQRTPLHLAAAEGFVIVARLLVEHGANVHARDRWHCRPLDDAMEAKSPVLVSLLKAAMRNAPHGPPGTASNLPENGADNADEVEEGALPGGESAHVPAQQGLPPHALEDDAYSAGGLQDAGSLFRHEFTEGQIRPSASAGHAPRLSRSSSASGSGTIPEHFGEHFLQKAHGKVRGLRRRASTLPSNPHMAGGELGARMEHPRRATLYGCHPFALKNGRTKSSSRVVFVPDSIDELLAAARDYFKLPAVRILHQDGGEFTSCDLILDGDALFAVTAQEDEAYGFEDHAHCQHCRLLHPA